MALNAFEDFTFNVDAPKAAPLSAKEEVDSFENITKYQKTMEPTTPESLINLGKLNSYQKDVPEIARFKDCLERRGWCFIELAEWDMAEVTALFTASEEFFASKKDEKLKFRYPPDFGYSTTVSGFKEGFKVLTGKYIDDTVLPQKLDMKLNRVCERLDGICVQIARNTLKNVFGATAQEILDKEQIPLMNAIASPSLFSFRGDEVSDGYGMFDIAYYTNVGEQSEATDETEGKEGTDEQAQPAKREKNVVAHGDPGIFSISLGSTSPGLEMFDPETDSWIAVKNDQCVFWNGAAAMDLTEERLKTGIHRVTYGDESRLTMWYEACALDQIPENVRNNGVTTFENLERLEDLRKEKGFDIKVQGINSWRHRGDEFITLSDIKPSNTIYEVMLQITEIEGLPPSKMMLSPGEESKRLKSKAKSASGVYGENQLEHDKLVSDYGIKAGDTISMMSRRAPMRSPMRMPNAGGKKKKKTKSRNAKNVSEKPVKKDQKRSKSPAKKRSWFSRDS